MTTAEKRKRVGGKKHTAKLSRRMRKRRSANKGGNRATTSDQGRR